MIPKEEREKIARGEPSYYDNDNYPVNIPDDIEDALRARIVELETRNAKLNTELDGLIKSIEGMTPGGSEFVCETSRCLTWIEEQIATTAKIAGQRNKLDEALRDAISCACSGFPASMGGINDTRVVQIEVARIERWQDALKR